MAPHACAAVLPDEPPARATLHLVEGGATDEAPDEGSDPDPGQTQNWRGLPVPREVPRWGPSEWTLAARYGVDDAEDADEAVAAAPLRAPDPTMAAMRDLAPKTGFRERRAVSISDRTPLTAEERATGMSLGDVDTTGRPTRRSECRGRARPCPWVSCRYHLYLDVSTAGNLVLNFPDVDIADMPHTCALDVADAGPRTLEDISALLSVTRERARQIEMKAVQALKDAGALAGFEALDLGGVDDGL